jgi:hypothetical protein
MKFFMKKLFALIFFSHLFFAGQAQIILPSMRGIFNAQIPASLYHGGKGYGDGEESIIPSLCPPILVQSIYYGGLGTDDIEKNIIQSNCAPLIVQKIYTGGTGTGDNETGVLQNSCMPLPLQSIYFGGTGYSLLIQRQRICPY